MTSGDSGTSAPRSRWVPAWLQRTLAWLDRVDAPVREYAQWRWHGFTRVMLLVLVIELALIGIFQLDQLIQMTSQGRQIAHAILAQIMAFQILALTAFHWTRSRQLAVQIANFGIFGAMVGGALRLGGPTSPTLPLLVLVPLLAALFSGARWGIFWTTMCIAAVVALRVLVESGTEFTNIIQTSNAPRANSIVLCLTYLATGFVVLGYEALNRRLRGALASERAELAYLADHDPLTGLSNRRSYEHELDRAFRRATRVKRGIALIAVDLDDFKPVNDRFGHSAGDELLRRVGERLHRCLRVTDLVARLGGDEFAILIEHIESQEDLDIVMQKIEHEMAEPFEVAGEFFEIRASLGGARYPDDGTTPDDLWQAADEAMFVAKRKRKVTVADR